MDKVYMDNNKAQILLSEHRCDQLLVWVAMTESEQPVRLQFLRVEETAPPVREVSIQIDLCLSPNRAHELGLQLLGAAHEKDPTLEWPASMGWEDAEAVVRWSDIAIITRII